MSVITTFDLSVLAGYAPRTWFADLYILNSHLMIKFLSKLDEERGYGLNLTLNENSSHQKAKVTDH